MRFVSASQFRAGWEALFQEMSANGEGFVITRWGRPFAHLEPVDASKLSLQAESGFGQIPNIEVVAIYRDAAR
jgi:hypothetical protein